MTTITIDRETRDVVETYWRESQGFYDSLNAAFFDGNIDEVLELRARLEAAIARLDELDWRDQNPRDGYEITVDEAFLRWVRTGRDETLKCIAGNRADSEWRELGERQCAEVVILDALIERIARARSGLWPVDGTDNLAVSVETARGEEAR